MNLIRSIVGSFKVAPITSNKQAASLKGARIETEKDYYILGDTVEGEVSCLHGLRNEPCDSITVRYRCTGRCIYNVGKQYGNSRSKKREEEGTDKVYYFKNYDLDNTITDHTVSFSVEIPDFKDPLPGTIEIKSIGIGTPPQIVEAYVRHTVIVTFFLKNGEKLKIEKNIMVYAPLPSHPDLNPVLKLSRNKAVPDGLFFNLTSLGQFITQASLDQTIYTPGELVRLTLGFKDHEKYKRLFNCIKRTNVMLVRTIRLDVDEPTAHNERVGCSHTDTLLNLSIAVTGPSTVYSITLPKNLSSTFFGSNLDASKEISDPVTWSYSLRVVTYIKRVTKTHQHVLIQLPIQIAQQAEADSHHGSDHDDASEHSEGHQFIAVAEAQASFISSGDIAMVPIAEAISITPYVPHNEFSMNQVLGGGDDEHPASSSSGNGNGGDAHCDEPIEEQHHDTIGYDEEQHHHEGGGEGEEEAAYGEEDHAGIGHYEEHVHHEDHHEHGEQEYAEHKEDEEGYEAAGEYDHHHAEGGEEEYAAEHAEHSEHDIAATHHWGNSHEEHDGAEGQGEVTHEGADEVYEHLLDTEAAEAESEEYVEQTTTSGPPSPSNHNKSSSRFATHVKVSPTHQDSTFSPDQPQSQQDAYFMDDYASLRKSVKIGR